MLLIYPGQNIKERRSSGRSHDKSSDIAYTTSVNLAGFTACERASDSEEDNILITLFGAQVRAVSSPVLWPIGAHAKTVQEGKLCCGIGVPVILTLNIIHRTW